MTRRHPRRRTTRRLAAATAALAALALALVAAGPASAASYVRISGEGSSWAGNAWADFAANAQRQGVTVDYTPNGSSVGRDDFANQTSATFADSEIPFTGPQSDPTDTTSPPFGYAMLPIVAGGTAFMYNLPIGGQTFRGLQLNMATIAGIFSGQITNWDSSAIAATNPGVALPNHVIDVVVRSDGSGATDQFKLWMLRQYPSDYQHLAQQTGVSASGPSSYFPTGKLSNFIAQNGSTGVTTYTVNTPYTIDYDEYSYAQQAGYPVAKVENAAGFFTTPTQYAVAVALIAAKIDTTPGPDYLSQDLSDVYTYGDPRTYPMSMYSYEIVPTQTNAVTSTDRGATLGWVSNQAVCEWQRDMGTLGYSPLPMNLVLAGQQELLQIPGIDSATQSAIAATKNGVLNAGTDPCNNPTFQPGDDPSHNLLVDSAPFPTGCDSACQAPWDQPADAVGSGPSYSGSGTTSGTTTGGTTTGGTTTGGTTTGGTTTGGTTTGGTTTSPGTGQSISVGALSTGSSSNPPGESCDADTGLCTSTTGGDQPTGGDHSTGGDSTTTGDGQTGTSTSTDPQADVARNLPTVIAADAGWTDTQWLGLILGGIAFLGLIAGPPVLILLRRNARPGRRP